MKTERILIYQDKHKANDFIKSVNAAMDQTNGLIRTFNSYQDFLKIETLEDFERLYADPLGVFDKTILQNIDIKAKGNKQPDPSVLPGYVLLSLSYSCC